MANLLNKGVMPMVHSFISRCSRHVWIRNIIANGCIRNASFAGIDHMNTKITISLDGRSWLLN